MPRSALAQTSTSICRPPGAARRRFRREAIEELRVERGLTHAQFARAAHVQKQLLGAWSAGYVTPTNGAIEDVAECLGVGVEYFYTANPVATRGTMPADDSHIESELEPVPPGLKEGTAAGRGKARSVGRFLRS